MRLTVTPVEGDEKWELLRKIVDKLESRDIRLDLNPFRRRDMKDRPYKWGYSKDSSWNEDDDSDYKTLTSLFLCLSCKCP